MNKSRLVESLEGGGYIRTAAVKRAFLKVPREDFLPEDQKGAAYLDTPLHVMSGQTISAPSMIAIMLEEASLKKGMKVLEIGAGSGYNAALIAEIVGQESVITIERLPELFALASINLSKAGYKRVRVVKGDGSLGHKEGAPYDRIIVTAAAPKMSKHWAEQLKDGGVIVAPIGQRHFYQELIVAKKEGGKLEEMGRGGCSFVPLLGEEGWES